MKSEDKEQCGVCFHSPNTEFSDMNRDGKALWPTGLEANVWPRPQAFGLV